VEGVIMFEIIPAEPDVNWVPVDVGHVQEDFDDRPGVKVQVVELCEAVKPVCAHVSTHVPLIVEE